MLGISDIVSDIGVVDPAAGPVAIDLDHAVGDVIFSSRLEIGPDIEVANPAVRREKEKSVHEFVF